MDPGQEASMAGPHLEDGPRAQDKTSDIWDVQVASGGRHANGRTKDELMERAMHVWVWQRILEGPCTITQAAPRNNSHTRVPSRGSHNSPIHNINMTVLCHRFRLRPKFLKIQRSVRTRHGTAHAMQYQHTHELALICDICWSHIACAVPCRARTLLWIFSNFCLQRAETLYIFQTQYYWETKFLTISRLGTL